MKTILIVLLTLFIGLPLGGLFMMLMVNYLFTSTVLMTVFGVSHLGFWKALVLTLLVGSVFRNAIKLNKDED